MEKFTVLRMEMFWIVLAQRAILSVNHTSKNEVVGEAAGGKLGAMIARQMDKYQAPASRPIAIDLTKADDVISCKVSDLPSEFTSNPDFPEVEPSRSVNVYPRSAIARIQLSRLSGMKIFLKKRPNFGLPIGIGFFAVGKAKEHLGAVGYPVM